MKTTALLAIVALSSFTSSRAEMGDVDSLYAPDMEMAETVASCKDNAPEGVDPANVIIAGTTCFSCVGSQTNFSFGDDAFNEDSVGCSCEDGSSCVSWAAVAEMVDANTFLDE